MKKISLILLISFVFIVKLDAQSVFNYKPYEEVKGKIIVQEGNKELNNPFAGGIDAAQFMSCDLDLDGKKDLITYDREGTVLSCFLNKGTANQIKYEYSKLYNSKFPVIGQWMLMADYNADGKEDLFFDINGSVACYKNISNPTDGFKLQLITKGILFTNNIFTINIGVPINDYPAIVDFDGDGDLDLFRFGFGAGMPGEPVEWFKNLSVEKTGTPGLDTFLLYKRCWGRFIEDINGCSLFINYPAEPCSTGGKPIAAQTLEEYQLQEIEYNKSNKHAGSTCLIADFNGDHLKDILIGDAGCDNMYLALNSTSNTEPIMNTVVSSFPLNHPINLSTFPSSFLVDVNNDGLDDLISCPNVQTANDNFRNVLLYLNKGTIDSAVFEFETDRFLSDEMIEVGEGASPSFVDYNQDGLIDIMIGSNGYFVNSSTYESGITLYKNIGTTNTPKFELITRDYDSLSKLNIIKLSPAFIDNDNDGDLDMICGSYEGGFHYFENIAGPNQPFNLKFKFDLMNNLDIGNNSAPFIYDIDKDGIKDIITGELFYNINYLRGLSITSPSYEITTDSLFKINMNNLFGYPSGRNTACISKLYPNDKDRLIISNADGKVFLFDTLYNNYNQIINHVIDSFQINQGIFSPANNGFKIDMADIDADGKPEIITGTPRGGIAIYANASQFNGLNINGKAANLKIYPNPTNGDFRFALSNIQELENLQLNNILNQTFIPEYEIIGSDILVKRSNLASGIYILNVKTKNQLYTAKVILQ